MTVRRRTPETAMYYLVVSDRTIRRRVDGTLSSSSVTCAAMKKTASGNAPTSDKAIKYQRDGGAMQGYSGAVNILTSTSIKFSLVEGNGTILDTVTVDVIDEVEATEYETVYQANDYDQLPQEDDPFWMCRNIINTTAFQTAGYKPAGWLSYINISSMQPYGWSATRKKINGKWSNFVEAAVSSHYGKDGPSGPSITPCGNWKPNTAYVCNSTRIDVVMIKSGEKVSVYKCTRSHTSGSSFSAQYWDQGNYMEFVAMDLALIRKIKADEIDVDNLTAAKVSTGKTGPRVEIQGSMISIFGDIARNIQIGVNEQGYAVLAYYDNNGQKIYDLGPNGIDWGSIKPASWSSIRLTRICDLKSDGSVPLWTDVRSVQGGVTDSSGSLYYKYYAGSNPTITEAERAKELYLYASQNTAGTKIPDGWYTNSYTLTPMWASDNTGHYIVPDPDGIYEYQFGGVLDQDPIYFRSIVEYKGGKPIRRRNVIWNGSII